MLSYTMHLLSGEVSLPIFFLFGKMQLHLKYYTTTTTQDTYNRHKQIE
jgi:hypothetical protein